MGQCDLVERIICSAQRQDAQGGNNSPLLMLPSVSFVGMSFLLLFKCDGFKAQNHEYNLGFEDYVRAIISGDLKKSPGFQFSDFGGTLLPHNYPFYDSHRSALVCLLADTAYIFLYKWDRDGDPAIN